MRTLRLPVLACLLAVYLVWGTTYFAISVALEGFAPLFQMAIRFLVAGALLMTFQRLRGAPLPTAHVQEGNNVMSWWGKIVGGAFGFMLGGPLGAVLGAAMGHQFDQGLKGVDEAELEGLNPGDQERVQTAFFTATFSVMGYIAKADGRVTPDEIAAAEGVMNEMRLSAAQRKAAIALFQEGKAEGFPLRDAVQQFRQECHRRRNLMQMFLEIQLFAAYADGEMHANEQRAIRDIGAWLGFSQIELAQLQASVQAHHQRQRSVQPAKPSLDQSYAVLGVDKTASDAEVKKAYRRLMSQHHPDKLVAKGLPEEMMKVATEKTHEIRQAYEAVRDARGL